jgi:hypothetical protein
MLAVEVLDTLYKCDAVSGWCNACERRQESSLVDAAGRAVHGVQSTIRLDGENGLYVAR